VNIIARTVISKLKTRAIRQLFGRTEEKKSLFSTDTSLLFHLLSGTMTKHKAVAVVLQVLSVTSRKA